MRIGLVIPRINGIGYQPGTTQAQIDSYTNSFIYGLPTDVEHGTAATPDVVAASLQSASSESCNNTGQCPDTSAQIAAAVARYTAAYNAAQANTQSQVESGQIGVPESYFTTNPGVYSPLQNPNVPNALNTVVPQQTSVTPAPPSSTLKPPAPSTPVPGANAGTSTGTPALASGPGALTGTVNVGGIDIPTWALLGAAALGIFMMVKGK